MQIHPSISVSVRPAPLAPERPAASTREVDARPRDNRSIPLGRPSPSPLGRSVRLAVEEMQARSIAGEARRGAPEPASDFDLRGHLAEIDRDMRKRLDNFGRQNGLNADEMRDLSRAFHAKLRNIYEAAKHTDAGPQRINRAVRRAFQGVRADLRDVVSRQVQNDNVSIGTAPGNTGVQPTSEVPPADDTSAGSGSGSTTTTSTVPGVTVSVGVAPPPPPPAPPSGSGEERDPLDVLAEAMTAFVQRFDSMMDLFEALISNGLGNGSGGGNTSGSSTSLFQTLADLIAAQESGTSVDTNG